jgi:hypothetical protein
MLLVNVAGRRWAWLLLGVVILASSVLASRSGDGHDYVNNVWAPTRGLLAGQNPYDPDDIAYFLRFGTPVVAGLYVPAALLLHAPLALLGRARSADVMMVVDFALLWAGVLLLLCPRRSLGIVVTALIGSAIVASAPAQDTVMLAQLSAWAFAGFALLVHSARRAPSATWLPAIAVTMVALKPQSALPIFVALAVLHCWPVLVRAAGIVVVTSLPGAVVAVHNAGGLKTMGHTVAENLRVLERLPTNDLATRGNLRIDALGLAARLGLPTLSGTGWAFATFAVLTVVLMLVLRATGARGLDAFADPLVATAVSVFVASSFIHLSYDQVLLYVGPLAATALVLEHRADAQATTLALGGVILVAIEVAFRASFRTRMVDAGLSALRVRQAWVTLPTLVGIALVAIALSVGRRAPTSEARGQAKPRPD